MQKQQQQQPRLFCCGYRYRLPATCHNLPQLATCHKSLNCTKFSSHALAVASKADEEQQKPPAIFCFLRCPPSPLPVSLSLCLARSLVALALTGRTINVFASVWGCATFWGIQMWPQLSRNENFNFLSSAFIAHNYKSPKAVAAASGQPPRFDSAPATCLVCCCCCMAQHACLSLAALDIQFCILQQMRVLPYLVGVQK